MKIKIFTDGGSRGNPGPAGAGGLILNAETEEELCTLSLWLGKTTNNQAEYRALISTLEEALKFDPTELVCHLDSELIVKQLNGQYRVKNKDLQPLFQQVKKLTQDIQVSFYHVYREQNKRADQLANQAMDSRIDDVKKSI